ncbi:SLATT domain-containing protein [Yersinia alsatica]|uniref:SLATT domain-containing protein n=1 Tax=Yersinia alsatica TaxID=2890317 RepID=UPI0011A588EC
MDIINKCSCEKEEYISLRDKIWFTYKARMYAHKRLNFYDVHTQFILIWYSLTLVIISVISLRIDKLYGSNTDIIITCLSIVVLVLTLTVTARDFRGRAISMRENYLGLQRLYNEINTNGKTVPQIADEYHNYLYKGENHYSIDDMEHRVLAKGLTSRTPSCTENIFFYSSVIVRYIIIFLLYILPAILIYHAVLKVNFMLS